MQRLTDKIYNLQPEEGEIRKDGKKVTINNPNDANDLGIGMVHQHFKLVECFSVLDNIVLGVETTKNGLLKMDEAKKKVMELSKKYGLIVDPDALIEDISVGMQQRTEILKMLYRDNEILIFDEPTAVLTPQEIKELMQIMKNLAKEGKSILFISHKLAEIMEVADRCSVLRKGKYIGTVDIKDATPESLSSMMVGRDVNFKVEKSEAEPREEVLHIEKLNVMCDLHDKLGVKDVSFNVKAGEIVCIAGIDGNGQRELVYGITGLRKAVSGKILLEGKDVTNLSIRERNVSGISHIPEDRHKRGLVLDYTVAENVVLQNYKKPEFSKNGILIPEAINNKAQEIIERLDVRANDANAKARGLSGGNQQKIIIGREVTNIEASRENSHEPQLLIATQPTRGVDVGAIEFVHKSLVDQRDAGNAVLLVSLELDEVMNVSDRIAVIYEGKIVGIVDAKNTNENELGMMMAGGDSHE